MAASASIGNDPEVDEQQAPSDPTDTKAVQRAHEEAIGDYLQSLMVRRGLPRITAARASSWLDREGLLADSVERPGKPLLDLLRGKKVKGQKQDRDRRWFIERVE